MRGAWLISACACLVGAFGLVAAEPPQPAVVSAAAATRTPWNGLIDVDFTAYVPLTGQTAAITLSAYDDQHHRAVSAKTFAGTTTVTSSGVYRVTWNAYADHPTLDTSALRVTVTATVTNFVPDVYSGNYMVVDLTDEGCYTKTFLYDAPAEGWSDTEKTDRLVLRKIPSGTFEMGTRATDWASSEEKHHAVTLTNDFWIGVFEVTQRQWEHVMGTRPSYFNLESIYAMRPVEKVSYNMIRGATLGAQWPSADAVDNDSFLYAFRTRTNDAGFDLPTEAEWEYACRAGTTTALNNGCNLTNQTSDASLDAVACYKRGASRTDANQGTAVVGSYQPNAWGLYDMHGNVQEFVRDWYDAEVSTTAVTNPVGPASPLTKKRLLRGGYWNVARSSTTTTRYCMSGMRNMTKQTEEPGGTPSSFSGLRLFCVGPGVSPTASWTGPTTGSGECAAIPFWGSTGGDEKMTLPRALDASELVFLTGTNEVAIAAGTWHPTNTTAVVGDWCGCSGSPGKAKRGKRNTAWMQTTVTGPGTFSFWWKVDSEDDSEPDEEHWDYLYYTVDGEDRALIGGQTDWKQVSFYLKGSGEHVIRWTYTKDNDDGFEPGEIGDCGWVDGVTWTSGAEPTLIIVR